MVKEGAKKIKKELEFGNSNINSKVFLKDDEKKFYIDMKKTNTVEKEVEESQKK
jgi:DNA-binding sugar fermentation-stimulating protein